MQAIYVDVFGLNPHHSWWWGITKSTIINWHRVVASTYRPAGRLHRSAVALSSAQSLEQPSSIGVADTKTAQNNAIIMWLLMETMTLLTTTAPLLWVFVFDLIVPAYLLIEYIYIEISLMCCASVFVSLCWRSSGGGALDRVCRNKTTTPHTQYIYIVCIIDI